MKSKITFLLLLACLSCQAEIKYVFYFIGDGMGSNQVLGAEMYQAELQGVIGRVPTLISQLPYSGNAATFSASNGITDSSAAGTCLATGSKTNNGVMGLNAQGDTLTSIAEILKAEGWGVGIMTTVAVDHATPAAFYANSNNRDNYYEIGTQLTESNFDFFGGAGFHHPQGKNNDEAVNLYDLSEERGYTIAHGYQEAQEKMADAEKMLMVQSTDGIDKMKHGDNLRYAIDRKQDDLTLQQIVSTAIPFLNDRYDRFFMMVEGGMIDYACHSDDAATAFGEVWDMNAALSEAYFFYLQHPDETLIVITADHETGGLALGNSDYTLNLQVLQHQTCSSWVISDRCRKLFDDNTPSWEDVKAVHTELLGLYSQVEVSEEEEAELRAAYDRAIAHQGAGTKTMYKELNAVGEAALKLLNKKAKIGWSSYAHTAHSVPIFAVGQKAETFSGWHDNSEIMPLILNAIRSESAPAKGKNCCKKSTARQK